jgi:hypothetical protein
MKSDRENEKKTQNKKPMCSGQLKYFRIEKECRALPRLKSS